MVMNDLQNIPFHVPSDLEEAVQLLSPSTAFEDEEPGSTFSGETPVSGFSGETPVSGFSGEIPGSPFTDVFTGEIVSHRRKQFFPFSKTF